MKFKNAKYWVKHTPLIAIRDSLAILLIAFLLRYSLHSLVAPHIPFHFFLIACLIIAFRYGYLLSFVALFSGAALGEYFFIPPYNQFEIPTADDAIVIITFLFVTTFGIYFIEKLQRINYSQNLLIKIMSDQHRTELFKQNELLLRIKELSNNQSHSTIEVGQDIKRL